MGCKAQRPEADVAWQAGPHCGRGPGGISLCLAVGVWGLVVVLLLRSIQIVGASHARATEALVDMACLHTCTPCTLCCITMRVAKDSSCYGVQPSTHMW